MAAAAAVVGVSTGVMKLVLTKLTTLMGNEYKKIKGLRKKVAFLQRELRDMDAVLEKMDNADELDLQAQNWRKDIIEMSYDIEDCIDDFMNRVGEADDKIGLLKKTFQYLKTFKNRHQLANQFQEMKTRVMEASERRKRYMLDQGISTTTRVVVDPRLASLYKESKSLVGIDAQKDELVNWAMDNDQELKVMSIVGHGGLGKTTLANEVYREVGEKYDCKSLISVSQRPEMTSLLSSLVSQLGLRMNSHASQVPDIIDELREHLQDKRYLIVVDDLWDVPSWDIIKCVFPENDKQSRVIVTTRHQDVAMSSCSGSKGDVHNMKPLNDQDSWKLFNNRIFGPEGVCPPQFFDVSCEILKKCGGLPLAIITVASILACRPTRLKEEWEHIQDCLLASQAPTTSTLTDMVHILDLSYKFLPSHLKPCFLYLGAYPEDWEMDKNELVRKWVAEGFVSGTIRRSAWDVAEGYLNELVNRSMIQRSYRHYLSFDQSPCYKVHDMMLDLILKRCTENNFLRLVHDPQAKAEVQVKVRRLTVHTRAEVTIGRQLSQVRSLSLFRAKCVPPLSELRFLRVLCLLAFPRDKAERIDLTCVSQLSQLRYLMVARQTWNIERPECHVVLPNQVRSMRRLETLQIYCLNVLSIPADIVDLPCLTHFIVAGSKLWPHGIAKVKTLRTLRRFRLPADSSDLVIESLGDLTSLEQLSLDCYVEGPTRGCIAMMPAWMAAWRSCLQKLGNLRVFSMTSKPYSCCVDAQISAWVSPPFPFLEVFDVGGWTFSRVPRWIGGLNNLHTLRFGVEEVSNLAWDDLSTMGMLPNLIMLDLRVEGDVPAEGIVIGGSMGFKLLRNFCLQIKSTSQLAFKVGAMPDLRALELVVHPNEWDRAATPVGLEHLESLQRIEVSGARGYTQTLPQNVDASFEAFCDMFREAITGLPTQPTFHSSYVAVYRPWDEEDN